jgi:steroid delta-isomerase-like uncharacterized protein
MSAADLYRKWIDAITRHDAAAVAELYAPNAVVQDPAYREPLEGRDAIRKDMEALFRAIPDVRVTTGATLEAGNTFAAEGRFSGTQQGPFVTDAGEIPATGRPIEIAGGSFWRLDGQGRILEDNRYYDLAAIAAQLEVTA